jgi:hypothetical protein
MISHCVQHGEWSRVVSLLEGYSRRLARLAGQQFPIVVNMGNGPFWRLVQDSHFLRKWSKQSFLRADSFSPSCTLFSVGGMAQGGEWSRFSNQGQAVLRSDSFSPGCTFFSAGGMAQGGEWSRLRNQNSYFSLLEKNSSDSPSLMFYSEGRFSFRSHRCE